MKLQVIFNSQPVFVNKSLNLPICLDVAEAVQDILLTLFTTVYNHQDDEGRCYSDSMAELPEHDEVDGKKYVLLGFFGCM